MEKPTLQQLRQQLKELDARIEKERKRLRSEAIETTKKLIEAYAIEPHEVFKTPRKAPSWQQ